MHKKTITCLNGTFIPAAEAMLPITDRGFRFGDGMFETIRIIAGSPYQWVLHLERLGAGLQALRITPPAVDWQHIAQEILIRNAATDGFLRLSISRGSGSIGYLPEAGIAANWAMEYLPATALPTASFTLHCSSITRPATSALPVHCKLAHGIGSTLALLEARDHGCEEALILNAKAEICEAASANIFWITGDRLYTPALTTGCLTGTTRAAILRLSADCEQVSAHVEALQSAECVFISNARLGIWPVRRIAALQRDYDTNHPIFTELSAKLQADYAEDIARHRHLWVQA